MEIDLDDTTVTEIRTSYSFAGTAVAVRTHETAATTFVFDKHLGSFISPRQTRSCPIAGIIQWATPEGCSQVGDSGEAEEV